MRVLDLSKIILVIILRLYIHSTDVSIERAIMLTRNVVLRTSFRLSGLTFADIT